MGRFSPTVLPSADERPGLEAFLSEFTRGPERLRQMRADKRAADEYKYELSQRPIQEAIRQGQLRELGIVKDDDETPTPVTFRRAPGPPPTAEFDQPPARAARPLPADLGPAGHPSMMPAARDPFINELQAGPQLPAGAFDPMTGAFTTPRPTAGHRIPLGTTGYSLDEALTPRGRAEAQAAIDEKQLTDAGIPAGIAAYAARHPENAQTILTQFFKPEGAGRGGLSLAERIRLWRETVGTRPPAGGADAGLVMPLDKAFAQIDRMFGDYDVLDKQYRSQLDPATRARYAKHLAETGELPAGARAPKRPAAPAESNKPGWFSRWFGGGDKEPEEEDLEEPDTTGVEEPEAPGEEAPAGAVPTHTFAEDKAAVDEAGFDLPDDAIRRILERRGERSAAEIDRIIRTRRREAARAQAPNTVGQPR